MKEVIYFPQAGCELQIWYGFVYKIVIYLILLVAKNLFFWLERGAFSIEISWILAYVCVYVSKYRD